MNAMLKVTDLCLKTPQGRSLFANLGFELMPGELLHIHGCNGSGKSTLLKAILGQYHHYTGAIGLDLKQDEVSLLSQMGNLQFLLPFSLKNVIETQVDMSDKKIIDLGLLTENSLQLSWNTASGGERQKALLTRCLLSSCKLLILDEPFNHLDSLAKNIIIKKLKSLQAGGVSIILNSHENLVDSSIKVKSIYLQDYQS